MKKYLSDYLPAALVRDLRRTRRSHGYVLQVVLALALSVWLMLRGQYGGVFFLSCVLMWFVVPNRAGAAVAADAKIKGTNFMMLTPLSARRIVWGTWFSALVQLLVVAIPGAVVVWWGITHPPVVDELAAPIAAQLMGEIMTPRFTPEQTWTLYALVVALGVLMCAVFMLLAQLHTIFRLGAAAAVLMIVAGWVGEHFLTTEWLNDQHYNPLGKLVDSFRGWTLAVRGADAALVLCTLLEFVRRSYAAPAENCSRMVRLATLLPLLSLPMLHYFLPAEEALLQEQLTFSFAFGILVTLCDAILPTYSLPAHKRLAWRVLPAYLQTPGLGQAALFFVLVLCANVGMEQWLQKPEFTILNPELVLPMTLTEHLKAAVLLLCGLLLTDVVCKRSNPNRPVIYVGMTVVCLLAGSIISVHSGLPEMNLLMEQKDAWYMCGGYAAGVLVLLALLMWRGRKTY